MKYIHHSWDQNFDGILFFIQRLEEMLFHYSDDIVRAPVHNTETLINEYLATKEEVDAKRVKEYQLDQIREELKDALGRDLILAKKFGNDFIDSIIKQLSKDSSKVLEYLHHLISREDYYSWCVNYLKTEVKIHNHKKEIEHALRSWIASVIWYGYSSEYVYSYLHDMFDYPMENPYDAICMFLDRFDFESRKYKVYFTFCGQFKEHQNIIAQRLPVSFEHDEWFKRIKIKKKDDFIGHTECNALDPYNAVLISHRHISIFEDYYRVLSNNKKRFIQDFALVVSEHGTYKKLPVISSGFKIIEDKPTMNTSILIDSVIMGCQKKSRSAQERLKKAIKLHNTALQQRVLNDGFVGMWSLLETVVIEGDTSSKIESIIDSIVPILTNDYLSCLFGDIISSMEENMNPSDYQSIIDKVSHGFSPAEKIMYLVFSDEYKNLLEQCFTFLNDYPIIRNKIYAIYSAREDVRNIKRMIESYEKRITWHIYRLYRARNEIVHSGASPKRIQVLGEHLHLYVDRILMEILLKLSKQSYLTTISDVFLDTKLLLEKKKSILKTEQRITDSEIEILQEYFFYPLVELI